MPFIPHTREDIDAMLEVIGADDLESLFDEIPAGLKGHALAGLPDAMGEQAVTRLMQERAARDVAGPCFIGAGAYRHHIPAAVWELTTRGEFYSAYTPYQAEASQGTLQLLYEFQSMMTGLTAMDVSNASLYDGASALAEAILMSIRANRKVTGRRVVVAGTLHPVYRHVAESIVGAQGIALETLDVPMRDGVLDHGNVRAIEGATAVVVQQPNFHGRLEDVNALTDQAHAAGALVIAVVNPIAMALLKPPGNWGREGADIVCGEGQPLGVPLSSGGPFFGFLCARQAFVRQMPGRIVGRTVDLDGTPGYTLTLQAREQHIRRSKATSNICTNQGLMVTAATIYMALLGGEGLRRVELACHRNTAALVEQLCALPGVRALHQGPCFHERVLELPLPAAQVIDRLAADGVLAGYDLGRHEPDLAHCLLICATELITDDDIARYRDALERVLREDAA